VSLPTLLAGLSLGIWIYLLVGRGRFWREPVSTFHPHAASWPSVVAVVPARDEAEVIGTAVFSLLRQNYRGDFRVVLVDDHSTDGTADTARRAAETAGAEDRLTVVTADPLPAGWTGKLWAMSEGLRHVEESGHEARLVLLTDADIEHDPRNLAELVARLDAEKLDMASLMVKLRCQSLAERAFIPAFVFFFQMLYPFAWVNDPEHAMAAAAGGCMLLRRSALARIGGIGCIRNALIDDCALGAQVKAGSKIWLGLSDHTRSLRPYPDWRDIWRMIARSAYTQLRYSPLLLAGTVAGMVLKYMVPPMLLFHGGTPSVLAALSWGVMAVIFVPTLRYYERSLVWAPLLPVIALFYLGATIDSARRHWLGKGGEWKGRVQMRGAQ